MKRKLPVIILLITILGAVSAIYIGSRLSEDTTPIDTGAATWTYCYPSETNCQIKYNIYDDGDSSNNCSYTTNRGTVCIVYNISGGLWDEPDTNKNYCSANSPDVNESCICGDNVDNLDCHIITNANFQPNNYDIPDNINKVFCNSTDINDCNPIYFRNRRSRGDDQYICIDFNLVDSSKTFCGKQQINIDYDDDNSPECSVTAYTGDADICGLNDTPIPTATSTSTPTATSTTTIQPTVTNTGLPTNTPTNTFTPTPTATGSVTVIPTNTTTPTNTSTHTPTATRTPTATPVNTNTPVPSLPRTALISDKADLLIIGFLLVLSGGGIYYFGLHRNLGDLFWNNGGDKLVQKLSKSYEKKDVKYIRSNFEKKIKRKVK